MDQGWVLWFCAGVDCGADGVVHADENEDKVAVDRPAHLHEAGVSMVSIHKQIPRSFAPPAILSSTEIASPT